MKKITCIDKYRQSAILQILIFPRGKEDFMQSIVEIDLHFAGGNCNLLQTPIITEYAQSQLRLVFREAEDHQYWFYGIRGKGMKNPTLEIHPFQSHEYIWRPGASWPENSLKLITVRSTEQEGGLVFELYELGMFKWNRKHWIICSPRYFWEDSRLFIDQEGTLCVKAFSYWTNLQEGLVQIGQRFVCSNLPDTSEWVDHISKAPNWTLEYFNPLLPAKQKQGTFYHDVRDPIVRSLNLVNFHGRDDDTKVLWLIRRTQTVQPGELRILIHNPHSSHFTWEIKEEPNPKQ